MKCPLRLRLILLFLTLLPGPGPLSLLSLNPQSGRTWAEDQLEFYSYKGQRKGFITWDKLDIDEWLDLDMWKLELQRRENNPYWKLQRRDQAYRELMGRVLSCINECRIYRGPGHALASYRSSLREGDEIRTFADSYAWVYLMDGSLVRISPHSSVSFKEFNVGVDANFLTLRLNQGYISWLNRTSDLYREDVDLPETDSLFLPLQLFQANLYRKLKYPQEQKLWEFLQEEPFETRKVKRLNAWIKKNNEGLHGRPSVSLLIMPNGNILGRNLRLEAFVIWGGESFFKQKTAESLFQVKSEEGQTPTSADGEEVDEKVSFFYRGFLNQEAKIVQEGQWYKVEASGKNIEEASEEEGRKFIFQEFLTSRIPTILMAREIMMIKYSKFLFLPEYQEKELITRYGYRLWGSIRPSADQDQGEEGLPSLYRRLSFLKEYTRRAETSNLFATVTLLKRMNDGENLPPLEGYSERFHQKALIHYLREMSLGNRSRQAEDLNSTQQKIWLMRNAAGNP